MENNNLPSGFEKHEVDGVQYKSQKNDRPQMGFGPGGRRGGPGRGMAQMVERPKESKKTLRRLIEYFGKEKRLLILLSIIVILSTVTALVAPSLQGAGIDIIGSFIGETTENSTVAFLMAVTGGENGMKLLVSLLWILLSVYIIQTLCQLFQTLVSARLSQRIVLKMRHDLFKKIDYLSIKYLDTHSNGDIMSRMTNDVENISNTVSQSFGSLISGVLTVIGTIAMMFVYCWQLTLITLVTVVLTLVVTKKLSKVMRKVYRMRSVAMGNLNGHSEEMITGYKSIVAYNRQDKVIDEFNQMSDRLTKVGIRAEILGGSMGPIMNCISNISFVIVAAFGGYFALKGYITVGIISAFIIYAKQFSRPINEIAQLYGSIQTAIAGAERVFELMDQPDEDNCGTKSLQNMHGEIEFKNVCFSYVPGKEVLHNFSLTVHPGQKIALVGATGSGKTTVVNLLMRFYMPDSGEILIDGVNINDISRDELRKKAAIVLQDTVLFSDTIEHNIKYADQNSTDEQMLRAAQMSNADGFIELLPEKYNTYLKHAGMNLSQGQRQLLAIARAVIANPSILILDEATSSVDTRTEVKIQDAMINLMQNRTNLIIAHRLSTVRDADVIVVMENGSVIESGNHDELLALQGRYYQLYMTQFAGNQI